MDIRARASIKGSSSSRTRGRPLGSVMPSPLHPPVVSPLNKCCSSSPTLQRAAEVRQPISRVLIATRRAHAASLLLGLAGAAVSAPVVRAEEAGGGGEGVVGAIKSIFDPNEKTKAGKVLPKAYLTAAREVVRTLRESLQEDDGGDIAKFRRNADAAKEAIREFLGGWQGQQAVAAEESYVALEKAIRSLAGFYSKAGPSASLPQEVKNKILDDLNTAEAYL